MKVLFVASGNSKNYEVVPFIKAQGDSLKQIGIEVSYFPVVGKGWRGYWKNASRLRNWLENHPVDIIHAHYTLSGWVAVLARPRQPVILSLMGSDAYGEYIGYRKVVPKSRYLTILTYLIQPFLNGIISKSANIDSYVYRKGIASIIPNGVRLEQFKIYKNDCRQELGLLPDKKYVLFLGNRDNKRKNIELVERGVQLLNRPDVELINPYPVAHDMVAKYLNAADVLVMSSFMEGSPNVVKEAMACNCPIVATDVGDAAWVIRDTPGCYVSSFHPADMSRQLTKAFDFSKDGRRTTGRERIHHLGLDALSVAERLRSVYEQLLKDKKSRKIPVIE